MLSRPTVFLLLTCIGSLYIFLTLSILDDIRVILKRRPTPLSHYCEARSFCGQWSAADMFANLLRSVDRGRCPRPPHPYRVQEACPHASRGVRPFRYGRARSLRRVVEHHLARRPRQRPSWTEPPLHERRPHPPATLPSLFPTHLIEDEHLSDADTHHSEHCLSLWREHTLCAADVTLEPGDPFTHNFTVQRDMGVRQCIDVEAFYSTMWKYWGDWVQYLESRGLEPVS